MMSFSWCQEVSLSVAMQGIAMQTVRYAVWPAGRYCSSFYHPIVD